MLTTAAVVPFLLFLRAPFEVGNDSISLRVMLPDRIATKIERVNCFCEDVRCELSRGGEAKERRADNLEGPGREDRKRRGLGFGRQPFDNTAPGPSPTFSSSVPFFLSVYKSQAHRFYRLGKAKVTVMEFHLPGGSGNSTQFFWNPCHFLANCRPTGQ